MPDHTQETAQLEPFQHEFVEQYGPTHRGQLHADAANFSRSGDTVNLIGTLDNTNNTFILNSTTGTWNLHGGTISGGIVAPPTALSPRR